MFKVGEQGEPNDSKFDMIFPQRLTHAAFLDSNMARDSFKTFIPLSVESEARSQIIFDFFSLLSAIAAHGKTNGFSGRKLSRLASWWAFEHKNSEQGFDPGYKSWLRLDLPTHLLRGVNKPFLTNSLVLRMPRAISSSHTYVPWDLRLA